MILQIVSLSVCSWRDNSWAITPISDTVSQKHDIAKFDAMFFRSFGKLDLCEAQNMTFPSDVHAELKVGIRYYYSQGMDQT